jgi:Gpi18-like mannosyltransferase
MKRIYRLLQDCFHDNGRFVMGLLIIGFTVRLVVALFTYGTEDVASWEIVGEALLQGQNPYQYTHFLRWPPLWMITIFAVKHLSLSLHLDFATLIKIPPIIADVAISVVIYYYFANKRRARSKGRLYAVLYAVNPISILIVAVHGQFDSIPVLFLLSSLYFLERSRGATDLSIAAMLLSLAIFAKTWPLLLVPLFVAHAPGRKARMAFLAISLLPCLVSVATLYALTPTDIYFKVVRYAGISGWWGFTSFYNVVQHPATKFMFDLYSSTGSYLLGLALGSLSLYYYKQHKARGLSLLEAVVSGILLIYILAPGYGTQYLIWIVPFVIIYSYRNRLARYFLVLASLELMIEYVFRPYNGTLGEWVRKSQDLRSEHFYASYAAPRDMVVTNLLRWPLWIYCGLFLATIFKRWRRSPAEMVLMKDV